MSAYIYRPSGQTDTPAPPASPAAEATSSWLFAVGAFAVLGVLVWRDRKWLGKAARGELRNPPARKRTRRNPSEEESGDDEWFKVTIYRATGSKVTDETFGSVREAKSWADRNHPWPLRARVVDMRGNYWRPEGGESKAYRHRGEWVSG